MPAVLLLLLLALSLSLMTSSPSQRLSPEAAASLPCSTAIELPTTGDPPLPLPLPPILHPRLHLPAPPHRARYGGWARARWW
jgi:hypothetical protein